MNALANITISNDPAKVREQILALEAAMRAEIAAGNAVEASHEMPLTHSFIPGCYARELKILAGYLVVGKIHRYPCFNVVLSGEITVLTEHGVKTIKAPAFFRSEGGVKRVGVAHTDTVWITIHPTDETDLEKLEAELICENFDEFPISDPIKELSL